MVAGSESPEAEIRMNGKNMEARLRYALLASRDEKFARRLADILLTGSCVKDIQDTEVFTGNVAGILKSEKLSISEIEIENERKKLEKAGAFLVALCDSEYPELLKHISDPPPFLWALGNMKAVSEHTFAVVGSRRASLYGKKMAGEIVTGLAKAGFTIASGLAVGIDRVAHQAALDAGGLTVAVVGGGLESAYPKVNMLLRERILNSGGLLLSEVPMSYPPLPPCFPRRNRIISGISVGVLVVEGHLRSGSLVTARHAREQNREVFAVPGDVGKTLAEGPNDLIRAGAYLVRSAEDVIESLGWKYGEIIEKKKHAPLEPALERILGCLREGHSSVDEMVEMLSMDASMVLTSLTRLEMLGRVRRDLGGRYLVV